MDEVNEIHQAMRAFVIRVLKGDCEPQETAILPKILDLLLPHDH